MKTIFGWAILGRYKQDSGKTVSQPTQVCNATATLSLDDLLRRFWETEEVSTSSPCYMPEEQVVLNHFKTNHVHLSTGRYKLALPKKLDPPPLGESPTQAVKRFYSNESSIIRKGSWRNSRMSLKVPQARTFLYVLDRTL